MTKVKICGLTNLDDAVVAAEAGADYLGFIFYPPSKRAADEKAVQCIASHLRSLPNCPQLVGVFVNVSAETIHQTLNFCDLDLAQLHGEEPIEDLHNPPLKDRAYKAIRPKTKQAALDQSTTYTLLSPLEHLPSLLIDGYHPDLYGGTGETSDWEMARRLTSTMPKLMLAGGLTPSNVADAIQQVQPWCVDIASGVEASPGIKDHATLKQFIFNAKNC